MKNFAAFILALALLFSASAVIADEPVFSRVGVHIAIDSHSLPIAEQTLVFDLRDGATQELVGSVAVSISSADSALDLSFDVPEYKAGKSFIFHMSQGRGSIAFDKDEGAYFVLLTYSCPQNGELMYCTDFYMTLSPKTKELTHLTLGSEERNDVPLFSFEQGLLLPIWALPSLGVEHSSAIDGGLLLYAGERALLLYEGQTCAFGNNEAFNLALPPMSIDGAMYVPLEDIAAYFGYKTELSENGDELSLSVDFSPLSFTPDEKYINSSGIKSSTDYLIWISKSEYKVRVYCGKDGSRKRINSFTCAIGAPKTPTCEGVYKYYQRQSRWEYDKYYCGPIMRFNGGYAIHSTLLKYDGSDYDARVGMKISHGCIRLKPENINWLADVIPLQTTVYITP